MRPEPRLFRGSELAFALPGETPALLIFGDLDGLIKLGWLTRLLVRLSIWLFRLHLGWVCGDRFLVLTHTGRKSGLPRQTFLEVYYHDQISDTYSVFSGWGEQSDWVRNMESAEEVS